MVDWDYDKFMKYVGDKIIISYNTSVKKDENNNFIVRVDKTKGRGNYLCVMMGFLPIFIFLLIILILYYFTPLINESERLKLNEVIGLISLCSICLFLSIYFLIKYINNNQILELKFDKLKQKVVQLQVHPKFKELWSFNFSEITHILYIKKGTMIRIYEVPHRGAHNIMLLTEVGYKLKVFEGDFKSECNRLINIISRLLDRPVIFRKSL